MASSALPLPYDPNSPLSIAGITDTSNQDSSIPVPMQPTTVSTGLTTAAKGFSIGDLVSSVGNFALGAFALSKLPANRIPVPAINTPTTATAAVSSTTKTFLIVGLLVVAALVVFFVMRRRG